VPVHLSPATTRSPGTNGHARDSAGHPGASAPVGAGWMAVKPRAGESGGEAVAGRATGVVVGAGLGPCGGQQGVRGVRDDEEELG
jgi:hypothetical protein